VPLRADIRAPPGRHPRPAGPTSAPRRADIRALIP